MTIGVPREIVDNERRVALVPDTVKRLTADGVRILVEAGAGTSAGFVDSAFEVAGATIVPDARAVYGQADLILKVQKPEPSELALLRSGTTLISFLQPLVNTDLVRELARRGVTSFSMDAIPRTTRAQSMDALSSMSTIGGYKAVLLAADFLPKFFPLLMTAAGTIPPAKVLIVGAGVAGLQAIATARRLGAVVEAYDTRPVVKEQVESLGAKFVEVDMTGIEAQTQDAGGYAREASPELLRRQQEAMTNRAIRSDVVITTALVPGRPAPKLISEETVRQMQPGSVIVDLAAETGGNCELTVPGEIVIRHGVTLIGLLNLPSSMPYHASQMYSKNLQNLLALMVKKGQFSIDMSDDIVAGTLITRDGEVVHEATKARLQAAVG
ncbi:MAG: Re/Si-specific NAD(P)(+) transhydrogenase subunit alpha [Chloroflexi bacterium]|nr:MAG: Re/Si-specific NAD(P)(+) transhydrogenase subunit alpha [Chloroflexota bacterium]